jgi:glycosidase
MYRAAYCLIIVLFNLSAVSFARAEKSGWAEQAVWYQIFPERFRNGDPSNDPTRDSLEWPVVPSEKWRVSRWTADWYARDDWETAQDTGTNTLENFYQHGIRDRRYGGDLQGVLDKLDYLGGLGVNALYFCPLFYSCSAHKYDGNSFHHIDPYFGPDPTGDLALIAVETIDPKSWQWTVADRLFLRLIKEAHRRGMKVMLDGVFNHSGRDFFAFKDLRAQQEKSAYKDWYVVYKFTGPGKNGAADFCYEGWWGISTLPVFSSSSDGGDMHPAPKAYIFAATRRWMDPDGDGDPSDGVDGWRLDAANERPARFWADWNAWVRKINPDAYTCCEIWTDPAWLIRDGKFSGAMNYSAFAYPVKGFLVDDKWSASDFLAELDKRRAALPGKSADVMLNLIDSHDTARLGSMIVNAGLAVYKKPREVFYNTNNSALCSETFLLRKPDPRDQLIQRLVVLFQMTYPGAPVVYYGDEAGMWGGNDPDCRMPMIWEDLKYDPQAIDPRGRPRTADDVGFDRGLFEFYKKTIALRRGIPALTTGDYKPAGAFDKEQTVAFLRSRNRDDYLVILNRSDKQEEVPVSVPGDVSIGKQEVQFVTTGDGGDVKLHLEGRVLSVKIPALTGVVVGLGGGK